MNPLAALRKLADEMREWRWVPSRAPSIVMNEWASTLDSALRLLGESEPVAWRPAQRPPGEREVSEENQSATTVQTVAVRVLTIDEAMREWEELVERVKFTPGDALSGWICALHHIGALK